MWKQRANELKAWLPVTPRYAIGAKSFLQQRFGVMPAIPFTPVLAFGLEIEEPENEWPPARVEPGAEPTGVGNQNS